MFSISGDSFKFHTIFKNTGFMANKKNCLYNFLIAVHNYVSSNVYH